MSTGHDDVRFPPLLETYVGVYTGKDKVVACFAELVTIEMGNGGSRR
jgi:hypothetical protein